MPDSTQALDERVSRLEEAISAGLARIEALLRQQIQDLKTEQIKDLKEEIRRIADDQRRLWEATRELERARNRSEGGMKVAGWAWNFLSAVVGAGLVAIVNRIGGGGH